MSQVQNQITDASKRQSKRKRVQVNYYEGGSDLEDFVEEVNDDFEESSQVQAKKRKTACPSRPLPKRKIFPFMKLPAEIRNMIYVAALQDPRGICLMAETIKYRRTVGQAQHVMQRLMAEDRSRLDVNEMDDMDEEEREQLKAQEKHWWMRPVLLAPGLLVVNKQVYAECRELLYNNDFHFADTLALHSFMVNIGPRAAALIKKITLRGRAGGRGMHKAYNHAAFAAMISATNIEKFTFKTTISWGGNPMWIARQVYRDSFPWLEAVGVAKGRFDAAIDLIELDEHAFEGYGWRRSRASGNPVEDKKKFQEELSKLLGNHAKQVWADTKPKRKAVMDEM